MAEVPGEGMPEPESDELGRYLEDTITIDWQTPAVMEQAQALLEGHETSEARVRALFEFVRDEVDDSMDLALDPKTEKATCRASEVLAERRGLCFAKSHLLAALLRYAGFPTGLCYVRLRDGSNPDRSTLHGFNAVHWVGTQSWIFLDARGNRPGLAAECRFEAPWSLPWLPDAEIGEAFLPSIYMRPARRIIDLLERAPDLAAVLRNLPDAL
ncbi:MAG: transglutaminase family protein [bacterium]|nr:hypothetical protein [Deltaproteobacteria bacterium]MCP4908055.1 transglutaminase family protein [bacterium]